MNRILRILLLSLPLWLAIPSAAPAQTRSLEYYETNVRAHFRQGRWQEGKALLDQALKPYGTLSPINELLGWYYYHQKEYEKARFYLIKSLREEPSNLHTRELLILVETDTENYSSAICYINEQLQYNPYNRGLWRQKIDLYRKMGIHGEADRLLMRLRQLYPHDAQVKADILAEGRRKYEEQRKTGTPAGQLRVLEELRRQGSTDPEFYQALTNLHLQMGNTREAAEAAGEGARLTGNPGLVRKRVSILSEMGLHAEASNYLREQQRQRPSAYLAGLQREVDEAATHDSQRYDPYLMYGRLYESQQSAEALAFLVNMSMARGYYDDALYYLGEQRKMQGESPEILYKQYLAHRRLGNTTAAQRLLATLVERFPGNRDALEEYLQLRLSQAMALMQAGAYGDALPLLEYAVRQATDSATLSDASRRLFNCYVETRQYAEASQTLSAMAHRLGRTQTALLAAMVEGKDGRQPDALRTLRQAWAEAPAESDRRALSGAYEELAVPYIRTLRERGTIRQAYEATRAALEVCPRSQLLLAQGISMAYQLGRNEEYAALVDLARGHYPDDPTFRMHEAGLHALRGDYVTALSRLRPLLDIYVGDSTLVNAHSAHSESLALHHLKARQPRGALAVLDTALCFDSRSLPLLTAKGRAYEQLKEYDSAYVYLQHYKPTLMDYRAHQRQLEELKYKAARNEVYAEFQRYRPGAQDTWTANAYLGYTLKRRRDSYIFSLGYAGRDGVTDQADLTADTEVTGGLGLQPGVAWQHTFSPLWSGELGASWGSKYFPQWALKASLTRTLKRDWTLMGQAHFRRIDVYTALYGLDANGGTVFTRWSHSRRKFLSAGAVVTKSLESFTLAAAANVVMLGRDPHFNANVKAQLFPRAGIRTMMYLQGGLGSAPELTLIDRSIPASFSKLNTFVSAGGLYVLNRYLALGLAGDWHTAYASSSSLRVVGQSALTNSASDLTTSYRNLFFIHALAHITF